MGEKEIEKILTAEVKRAGGRAYKWLSPGNDGVPDRIVILPGKAPVFVELKSDTGRLSRLQRVQIERLEQMGQTVFVARGIQGVIQFLKDMGCAAAGDALEQRYILTTRERKDGI